MTRSVEEIIKLMGDDYEAKGYSVTYDADASAVGIDLPFAIDILAVRAPTGVVSQSHSMPVGEIEMDPNGNFADILLVEVANRERDPNRSKNEDIGMQRFHALQSAINARPEVDFIVRFAIDPVYG